MEATAEPRDPARRARWLSLAGALAMAALAAAILYPVVSNGFVELRDRTWLLDNDRWQGLDADRLSWMFGTSFGGAPRPFAWLSLAVDHALAGVSSTAIHVTALAMHAATAALLCTAFLRWIEPRHGVGMAMLMAMLWAIHPQRLEVVAWASARGEVLAGLFGAAALLAWTYAFDGSRVRRGAVAGTAVLVACALASDPLALGLPVALVALAVWMRWRAQEALDPSPSPRALWGASAVIVFPAAVALGALVSSAPVGLPAIPLGPRLLGIAGGSIRALRDLVWPVGLHPAYDPPAGFPEELHGSLLFDGVLLVLMAMATVIGLRKRSGGAVVGAAFLALILPPLLLGHEPVGADRFAHLATVPLFAAATVLSARAIGRGVYDRLFEFAVFFLIIACIVDRRDRIEVWRDEPALAEHVLTIDPTNEAAMAARAEMARHSGEPLEVAADYHRRSVAHGTYRPLANALLGEVLQDLGDPRAEEHFRIAATQAPWMPAPRHALGALALRRGELDEAARELRAAVRLDDRSPGSWYTLGRALDLAGNAEDAAHAYRKALDLAPDERVYREALERVEARD